MCFNFGGLFGDNGNVVVFSDELNDVISEFKGVNESSRRLLNEFLVADLGLLMNDYLLLPGSAGGTGAPLALCKLLVKLEILVLLLLFGLMEVLLLLLLVDDDDEV